MVALPKNALFTHINGLLGMLFFGIIDRQCIKPVNMTKNMQGGCKERLFGETPPFNPGKMGIVSALMFAATELLSKALLFL